MASSSPFTAPMTRSGDARTFMAADTPDSSHAPQYQSLVRGTPVLRPALYRPCAALALVCTPRPMPSWSLAAADLHQTTQCSRSEHELAQQKRRAARHPSRHHPTRSAAAARFTIRPQNFRIPPSLSVAPSPSTLLSQAVAFQPCRCRQPRRRRQPRLVFRDLASLVGATICPVASPDPMPLNPTAGLRGR